MLRALWGLGGLRGLGACGVWRIGGFGGFGGVVGFGGLGGVGTGGGGEPPACVVSFPRSLARGKHKTPGGVRSLTLDGCDAHSKY